MKIASIDAFLFRLPLRRDVRWASLLRPLGGFVFVEVHTDEGTSGVGEANALPDWGGDHGCPGGETQRTVVEIVKGVIEPALVGLDALSIEAAHLAMDRVLRGNSYARCAVDMALHDLWGKTLGQPVYRLLGGPVRETVRVAHMVGIMPTAEAMEEARIAQADGITALQIKGGADAHRDVEAVRCIRDAVGPDMFLRLDANQGYQRAKTAVRVLAVLQDALDMVEQPVADLTEMAETTRRLDIDVIADESCWTPHDALRLAASRGADAISIYLAKAGGIVPAKQVAAIAATAGLPCDINGSLESAIGNAANLQFALATPVVTLPSVIPLNAPAGRPVSKIAGRYYEDDICVEPFAVKNGHLVAPDLPGLGVAIDREKLERYREE